MKKHFLHLNRLAGLLVVCLALTACDPNPDPDDSGTVPPPPPNGKRLVSMTKDKGGHQVYTDVFEYNSKGQIIRVDDKTNSSNTTYYTYTDSTITVRSMFSTTNTTYTLSKGRIVRSSSVYYSYGEVTSTYENTYEYDSNGCLIKVVSYYKNGDEDETSYDVFDTTIYTWANGNVTKVSRSSSYDNTETAYEYSDYSISALPYFGIPDIPSVLAMQGYFGKLCRNLIASETTIDAFGNSSTGTYDYTITDGVVTRCIDKFSSIYTFVWE
ncbi:MAG: DUF4595 domain-containing protein [Prevotella sp.]|nr:DUF4595 domain-containing protein [Prevotella sp.]